MKLLALCCDSSAIQKKNLYPVPSFDDVSLQALCPGAWHPVDMLVLLWRVSYTQSTFTRTVLGGFLWDSLPFHQKSERK